MMLIFSYLLACRDEQLAPLVQAAEHYDRGHAAFEAGQFDKAAAEFSEALASDPGSPVLMLWTARSLAAGGQVAEAEALATRVIEAHPSSGLAWYNRASWRSRQGHHAAAAADLQRALELGAASRFEAAADRDFGNVLGDPAYARILPPSPIVVQARGPSGSVFVGSDVEIELTVLAAPGLAFTVTRGGLDPGCLSPRSIVEERVVESGAEKRTLRLRFRAVAACAGELGPFIVRTSAPVGVEATSSAVALVVEAPASFVAPPVPPLPRECFVPGEHVPSGEDWSVGRSGDLVFALGRADVRPLANGLPPEVEVELREDGTTRAAGGYWTSGATEVVAGGFRQQVP